MRPSSPSGALGAGVAPTAGRVTPAAGRRWGAGSSAAAGEGRRRSPMRRCHPILYHEGATNERPVFEVTTLEDGCYQVRPPRGRARRRRLRARARPAPSGADRASRRRRRARARRRFRRRGARRERHLVEVLNERQRACASPASGHAASGGPELRAPWPARSWPCRSEGDEVDRGRARLIVEAMKMENDLKAHIAGTIEDCTSRSARPSRSAMSW